MQVTATSPQTWRRNEVGRRQAVLSQTGLKPEGLRGGGIFSAFKWPGGGVTAWPGLQGGGRGYLDLDRVLMWLPSTRTTQRPKLRQPA